MKFLFSSFLFFFSLPLFAQKKPLDHSVYDGWQSIGERMISNNGRWVVYTVTPQEGDAELFIYSTDGAIQKQVPRGYGAVITEDSRFLVFKIRPPYADTREARIKKKRPEDLPKDSIAIIELGKDDMIRVAKVKSFKTPQKGFGWIAYQKEKEPVPARSGATPTQKTVDSLRRTIDSLVLLVTQIKNLESGSRDEFDADGDPVPATPAVEGSDLVLRNLLNGKEELYKNVVDYYFNEYGQKLVMRVARNAKDIASTNAVVVVDLVRSRQDTILKGGNDFRNFSLSEDGSKIAFVAERDTNRKALQKFYDLYLYRNGDDSAAVLISKHSVGMQLGMTVSENANLGFSKSGNRLFFGTAPITPPRDTSLVDIELVKLDIWHYKDDYLQTQQLSRLNNELKRSYMAVYDFSEMEMQQLGSDAFPMIVQTNEGDGDFFIAITDTGRRVESQWAGSTKKDIYALDVRTGEKKLVKKNHDGGIYPSSTGKYILLYDNKARQYFAWNGSTLKNISSKIKVPLYDEEHDSPDDPGPYGIMGWHQGDSAVYVYDRYDVWKVDPAGIVMPVNITNGRGVKNQFRYIRLDPEEKFFTHHHTFHFRAQNQSSKKNGIYSWSTGHKAVLPVLPLSPEAYAYFGKARNAESVIFTRENYVNAPDLYLLGNSPGTKISGINSRQSEYNWGTAELYKWKTFNGKQSEGILYKPEDFDPNKKYPMIIYFYEKLSDGLYNYHAPAPTPSRLNIPFFVSRGYLVFAPDISYTNGHPAKSAYNYIVSGAQALAKNKWVDSKNIGIQGQSWGGIQVAQLITMTNMFKAAWAGAPVSNMFSAYGGIRWESGNNRQVQYEKGQSRIGFTPWERPDLYIENSPLFHLKKVNTPLVIMANDADGAVPWYQGIELFTAMRRLNKKAWMLNYNGEAHNLVERKNRKDIQVREQQYFDWLLKGEKPPRWITEGVPAVKKGKDWGFELVY